MKQAKLISEGKLQEEWRPITGFEGAYSISNLGRVMSHAREIIRRNGRITRFPETILKLGDLYSYKIVALCINGKMRNKRVHRLVAEAFIPNPQAKPQINHKDGVKDNNIYSNLEWVSPSENALHSYRVLGNKKIGVKGEKNPTSKLKESDIFELYEHLKNGGSRCSFAKKHKISRQHIRAILNRESWKHLNIDWSEVTYRIPIIHS